MTGSIIKICGITRMEDGLAALEAGADWLGFIRFAKSPRYRPLEACSELVAALRSGFPGEFQAVGVFVDTPVETMKSEIAAAGFDRAQLHGSESMEVALALSVPVIKALRVTGEDLLAQARAYPGLDLLTDAPDPVLHGGTGKGYDPAAVESLVRERRVLVAGGLSPENVEGVVQRLHPYGVDVSSGVERSPGVKDHRKVRAFVEAARRGMEIRA